MTSKENEFGGLLAAGTSPAGRSRNTAPVEMSPSAWRSEDRSLPSQGMPINEPKQLRVVPGAHPAPRQLEAFMRGLLPRRERPAVVRHLLTGCPECVAVTGRMWASGDLPRPLTILAEVRPVTPGT